MKRFLLLLVVVTILLIGCAPVASMPTDDSVSAQEIPAGNGGLGGNNVFRYIDEEAGVVCWIYSDGYRGGISCLPLVETNLYFK